jgi:hypothetical protein
MENSHPTGAAPTQSPHELALTPETLKELWRAGQQQLNLDCTQPQMSMKL